MNRIDVYAFGEEANEWVLLGTNVTEQNELEFVLYQAYDLLGATDHCYTAHFDTREVFVYFGEDGDYFARLMYQWKDYPLGM